MAAMAALEFTADQAFHGISALWTGVLLQRGSVFQRQCDGSTFLSLDFHYYAALGWKMERLEDEEGSKIYWIFPGFESTSDAAANLEFLCNSRLSSSAGVPQEQKEQFLGVPCELRTPALIISVCLRLA